MTLGITSIGTHSDYPDSSGIYVLLLITPGNYYYAMQYYKCLEVV